MAPSYQDQHSRPREAAPVPSVLCVVGFPGPLTDWCAALLSQFIGAEDAQIFPAQSLADLGRRLLDPSALPAVALIHHPDAALGDALSAQGHRFVMVTAEPRAAVEAIARDGAVSAADAARAAANAHVTMTRLANAPGALAINADAAGDAASLAAAIAAHWGFDTPRIAPPLPRAPEARPRGDVLRDGRALIEEALGGSKAEAASAHALAMAVLPPPGRPIIWPRDLFLTGAPGVPANGAIDLTGPSRCLLYGPYIRLPAGHWSCTLLFGCSPEATGLAMAADIYAGRHLAQVTFTIEEAGIFEVEIPFENPNPDVPLEIRLFSTRAAFEGRIAIGHAALTPSSAKRLKAS